MEVKSVPEMGWTNRSVANTILLVNQQQKRELAGRIQRLMDERGLTNERLAYKAGVSSKTVSRVLNAKHELRLGTIEKLAEALDVSETVLRGPPPAPLGLGADDGQDYIRVRLARIERKLDELTEAVDLLASRQIPDATTASRAARQRRSSTGRQTG